MGLLDYLSPQYAPSGGGGLLDFLRTNALGQQMPAGPDQAQYAQPQMPAAPSIAPQNYNGPSPLDNAQWPAGPVGAPSQAQAQIPGPQISPIGGAASDFGSNALTGLQSFLNGAGLISSIRGAVNGQRVDPGAVAERQQQQAQNLTFQALVQKGVDPVTATAAIKNPEMLKTLVTQTFGPKTVTPLGNGYVADRNGKITRAYEPEDKIPQGFVKDDNGNMHFIPGGPADPAYLRDKATKEKDPNAVMVLGKGGELYKVGPDGQPVVVHKNSEGGDGEPLTTDAIDLAARRVISADPKALTNLGRGAQGRADLVKINNRIAELMKDDPAAAKTMQENAARQAGLVSSARALGTKETHFGVAEKAMEESLPLAQAASDAVPRTDWIHLNKLIQAGQTEHANPLLKRFLIATDTAAKDYARTINPTGALRESDIEYARKILSTADGPEAYRAALDQLRMEAGVMHRAIQRQKGELYGKKPDDTAKPVVIDGYTIKEH